MIATAPVYFGYQVAHLRKADALSNAWHNATTARECDGTRADGNCSLIIPPGDGNSNQMYQVFPYGDAKQQLDAMVAANDAAPVVALVRVADPKRKAKLLEVIA